MNTFRSFTCIFQLPKLIPALRATQQKTNCLSRAFTSMAIRPAAESVAKEAAASIHQPRDPNTLSNYNAWRTKHTTADFNADFDAKLLKGTVHLTLERLAKGEKKVVLDTR